MQLLDCRHSSSSAASVSRAATQICVWFLLFTSQCVAAPKNVLRAGATKCFDFEATMDSAFRLDYEAEDVSLDKEDTKFNSSFITITWEPDMFLADFSQMENQPKREVIKREFITALNGTVRFETQLDGRYSICVRAPPADFRKANKTPPKMYRFSIRLRATEEDPDYKVNIDKHLTSMEAEIQRVQVAMKNVLRQADYAKTKDMEMHKQFLALHSTTFYWPIMQLCVLLITGFTQVRHIVNFFSKLRII